MSQGADAKHDDRAGGRPPAGVFPSPVFWKDRKVFVTGHTGFKGSWLCAWLTGLGADVTGYALAPATEPNMFDSIHLAAKVASVLGDIRDRARLEQALETSQPEIVFHLAAQSLVRASYRDPLDTIEVNVLGTANLLEACRSLPSIRSVVVISSDKCYRNEAQRAFTEEDPLGGRDPYSASKACTEIITGAFRDSFFSRDDGSRRAAIASARAGNVIGGGDWAKDRIVPDLVRALDESRPAAIRNPQAVRPWQHVLDPTKGYLMLAQAACRDRGAYSGGFNFGPDARGSATVADVVDGFAQAWDGRLRWKHTPEPNAPYEAPELVLDASKAHRLLGWQPSLELADAIKMTAAWYDACRSRQDMAAFTSRQINAYVTLAGSAAESVVA